MSEQAAQHHDRHHGDSFPGGGTGGIGSGIRGDDAASIWDERYRTKPQMWSGKPNPQLVREAGGLKPGKALDLGCGEGADAIWLAGHGWQVTAVDVSTVALARAAERAAEAQVADRITWEPADALVWDPAPRRFDLVSAQFMHLPGPVRQALHRRLAAAVRPGGSLLVVGHHPSDLETTIGRRHLPDLMFTAEQVASVLDPADWRVVRADAPGRTAVDPDGRSITIHDAVLHAVRLG